MNGLITARSMSVVLNLNIYNVSVKDETVSLSIGEDSQNLTTTDYSIDEIMIKSLRYLMNEGYELSLYGREPGYEVEAVSKDNNFYNVHPNMYKSFFGLLVQILG